MSLGLAVESMSFDAALKAFTFRGACNVDHFAGGENVGQQLLAHGIVVYNFINQPKLVQNTKRREGCAGCLGILEGGHARRRSNAGA